MTELFPVTREEAVAELRRELKLRNAVYPGFIARGRLKQATADRQIARLVRAIELLEEMCNGT